MRRHHLLSAVAALLIIIWGSACSNTSTQAVPIDSETLPRKIDPNNFDNPTNIDNEWMPLKPGIQFVYEGTTVEDDGTTVPHRVEVTVTDLTKVIGDIRTVVTWDLDYSDNELVEAELAFYAQDNEGNVWRVGEYPEEYEEGKLVAAPTWIHGIEDARAGIMMMAEPELGTSSYAQGWAPAVDWTDRGQVDQIGQKICVATGCYEDVLVIAESSQSEPDAQQLKYYAPGVGNIQVGWRGAEEKTKETLELVELNQLSPQAMEEVRAKALELEKSAYETSKDVYAYTSPAEYPEGTPAISVEVAETPTAIVLEGPPSEIVVYASDLTERALYELEFWDDPASPGNKMIGIPNNGDELDPPPENDPHATLKVQVHSDLPYRCWIHMKVGTPKGKSQANVIWVQFSDAVDKANQEVFKAGTGSYLTAQGPTKEGWTWVGCDLEGSDSLIYFPVSGGVTVRLQAGMEGVGFDQFVLSPEQFLENPPSEAVVNK